MSATGDLRLTKKQRKAAEFKQKKGGSAAAATAAARERGFKRKAKAREADDVPEQDFLDETEAGTSQAAKSAASEPKRKSKKQKDSKEKQSYTNEASTSSYKKRQRARDKSRGATERTSPRSSRSPPPSSFEPTFDACKAKKTVWDDSGEAKNVAVEGDGGKGKKKAEGYDGSGRKLIVFVGNISFKSTAEQIKTHFTSHCGEEPFVRLLTTKPNPSKLSKSKLKSISRGKAADMTVQSKGYAFVEFRTVKALQKALGLHHLQFGGRQINVELTAGGGGNKSSARNDKIRKKNRALGEERKRLHEKYVQSAQEKQKADVEEERDKGLHVGPPKKRSKAGDEGEAQWGERAANGKAAAGQTRKITPWMASGANTVYLVR